MTFTQKLVEYAKSCVDKTRNDLNLHESLDWCAETVKHIVNKINATYGATFNISCTQSHKRAISSPYWYEPDDDIKVGDIIYYNWNHDYDPTGDLDHTGIVVNVTDSYIEVVEGNTKGRENTSPVCLVRRNRAMLNFNCSHPDFYIRIKPEYDNYNDNPLDVAKIKSLLHEIEDLLS